MLSDTAAPAYLTQA